MRDTLANANNYLGGAMDWDTFYFKHWVETHEPGDEPTHEDYQDWLFDKADLALGKD